MTAYTTDYGTTIKHGRHERLDLGGWMRMDELTPSDERQPFIEGLHAAGRRDDSRGFSITRGYDSTCSWCYLGAGHTTEAHEKAVSS